MEDRNIIRQKTEMGEDMQGKQPRGRIREN